MSIKQRVRDWLREREIRRLSARCKEAIARGDRVSGRAWWSLMAKAISERSLAQVERMNRARGLR